MASNKNPLAKKIAPTAFSNEQLTLFQTFLCNTDHERDQLSNSIDLWDSVPRYSVSRIAMNKMRAEKGFLDLLEVNFNYKGLPLKAIIQPARIREADGSTKDYYPSANEELVEDALRKIAAEKDQGFFDKPNYRTGVVFSLYMLHEELKKRGHTRSYLELVQSLYILAGSSIKISTGDENEREGFTLSNYFPTLTAASKKKLKDDPEGAKWVVQFHPLVAQSLDKLTYRQFNYHLMMQHSTQLARWLHKQLALKFTFASMATSFEMRFSTIKRDSGLLEGYSRNRSAIEAVDTAFEEFRVQKVLMSVKRENVMGPRKRIIDVIYNLTPSIEFVGQMKAANKRKNNALE